MTNPLRDLLARQGVSQRSAARMYGIPQATIKRWCHASEPPENVMKLVTMLLDLLEEPKRKKKLPKEAIASEK